MSLLAPNHNRPKAHQPSLTERRKHEPRHSAERLGRAPVAAALASKIHEAATRQHEKNRQRGRHLERIARVGAHLVQKALGVTHRPQKPKAPAVIEAPVVRDAIEAAPAPEAAPQPRPQKVEIPLNLFDAVPNIKDPHTWKLAMRTDKKGNPVNDHHLLQSPPLATARRAYEELTIDIGTVLAYIDLPGKEAMENLSEREKAARRVYIVDRGARLGNANGDRQPEIVLMGHNHLEQMVQSKIDGGQTPAPVLKNELPVIHKGESVLIGRGEKGWLPYDDQYVEAGIVPDIRPDIYANTSRVEAKKAQAKVEITGSGHLYITGMGKNEMNLVVGTGYDGWTPQDPWPGSPAGMAPKDLESIRVTQYDLQLQQGRHHQ